MDLGLEPATLMWIFSDLLRLRNIKILISKKIPSNIQTNFLKDFLNISFSLTLVSLFDTLLSLSTVQRFELLFS